MMSTLGSLFTSSKKHDRKSEGDASQTQAGKKGAAASKEESTSLRYSSQVLPPAGKISDDSAYAGSSSMGEQPSPSFQELGDYWKHNRGAFQMSGSSLQNKSQQGSARLPPVRSYRASFDTAKRSSNDLKGPSTSQLDSDLGELSSSSLETSEGQDIAGALAGTSPGTMGDVYTGRRNAENRVSIESRQSRDDVSSQPSRRSSFALERASFESNRASLDRFQRVDHPAVPVPAGRMRDPIALCAALRIPQAMWPRFLALTVVPVDTPLPMSMLRRLWHLKTNSDAEATANLLEQLGVMKVACLADNTAWALVQPGPLKALHDTASDEMRVMHTALIEAYKEGSFWSLADVVDDGYIMQNAGHHLVNMGRLCELRELLMRPAWLECKLHSYGVASVVADFRRYLMAESDEGIKLLLESFQMSVGACLANPGVAMLHAQLAGRLMLVRSSIHKMQVQLDERKLASAGKADVPGQVMCLRTRTPSLEQAGGLQRMTLRGHTGGVKKVLLTPGGIDVITSSTDGTSRVWDMEIGDCVLLLEGHTGAVTDMATAAAGSVVVTASEDGTARVWDLDEGHCLNVLVGHSGAVNSVAVNNTGALAVTAGADGTGRVWNLASASCVQLLLGHTSLGALHKVVLTSDGQRAITCSSDFTARVWEVLSGDCLEVCSGHTAWVVDAALTRDDSLLVTGSHDSTARVWDLSSGRCLHVLTGHLGRINAVRIAPDDSNVVTVADDFTARVFDLKTGECRHTLEGHGGWVSDCAIANNLDSAITVSGDDLAVVWDIMSGSCKNVLEGHSGEVLSVVLTRRGRFAVTGSMDGTARIWDLAAGSAHLQQAHSGKVHGMVVSPGSAHVISFGDDGCLVWNAAEGTCTSVLEGQAVRWASCVADGKRLLCASGDRTTNLWDLTSATATAALPGTKGSRVKSFAASQDGQVAVIVLFDSTVTVWDLETHKPLVVLQRWGQRDAALGHTAGVNAAYITRNGTRVLTVSKDTTARIWDVASGRCLHTLEGHLDGITSAVISDDGQCAVTLAYDNSARLWDMQSGACRSVLPHAAAVTRAVFSPDGLLLLTASADHQALLWSCEADEQPACRLLRIFKGHQDDVTGIAFSCDGTWAATCARDNSLRLWNIATGYVEGVFVADASLTCCAFAGDTIFTGDDAGIMHLLQLPHK